MIVGHTGDEKHATLFVCKESPSSEQKHLQTRLRQSMLEKLEASCQSNELLQTPGLDHPWAKQSSLQEIRQELRVPHKRVRWEAGSESEMKAQMAKLPLQETRNMEHGINNIKEREEE